MPRRGRILVMAAIVDDETDLSALLDSELPEHPDLVQGQLENGLKYVILPNSVSVPTACVVSRHGRSKKKEPSLKRAVICISVTGSAEAVRGAS
jgi:hypothetical protein